MDWKRARARLTKEHVSSAARWIDEYCSSGDFANLYEKTGCHPPRRRFIDFARAQYPAKAFGYLALINAGWDRTEDYRPTVNEVINAVRRFGVTDIHHRTS